VTPLGWTGLEAMPLLPAFFSLDIEVLPAFAGGTKLSWRKSVCPKNTIVGRNRHHRVLVAAYWGRASTQEGKSAEEREPMVQAGPA